jgi:small conductance mechanosensitive channel
VSPVLAQVSDEAIAQVCGPPEEGNLLCRLVYRATGSDAVAEAAGVLGTGLRIALILVLATVLTLLLRRAIGRFSRRMERRIQRRLERGEERGVFDADRYRSRRFQRLRAITGVLRGAAGVVVWLTAVLIVLDTLGVRLQPILAGAGLAGIVVGFGAQQLVRDVLAGISMLIEDQYGGGDWIEVDGKIGQVERVGLRATSFRDLDGILWHVANGYIQQVGNYSQEWSRSLIDVPLALDSDVPTAKAIIHKVATDLCNDPIWGSDTLGEPEIWGVQDFGPTGLSIRLVIPTKPMANWDINRQLRERLHHAFERANIRMQGQLVELGGMPTGYPVLHRTTDDEAAAARTRRRGIVPADVGPFDRPVEQVKDPTPHDPTEALAAIEEDDPYAETPDRTTELRRDRGREPRPD